MDIPNPLLLQSRKIKGRPAKAKKILKIREKNSCAEKHILDFDRLLEELFEEELKPNTDDEKPKEGAYSSSATPISGSRFDALERNNICNKIQIETKLLIKCNLINKLSKKDQRNILKPETQKEFAPLKEKIPEIKKQTVIKIPNSLQKGFKNKTKIKENSLNEEISKLRKLNQEKLVENSNAAVKKIVKIYKRKINKFKKRTPRRDSNLYDINNFVVQNNSNKINERKDVFDIPIPVFKELADDFYLDFIDNNDKNSGKANAIFETCAEDYSLNGKMLVSKFLF